MPRPDFSVQLPSWCLIQTDSVPLGTTQMVLRGSYSAEDVTGPAKRRKPKGWVPPTSYGLLAEFYYAARGTSSVRASPTNWSIYTGCVGGGTRFNSSDHFLATMSDEVALEPLDTSLALTKARNKLKGSSINLGVAYGERKATSMMLGSTAGQLGRAVRFLRHGEFRAAARQLGIRGNPGRPRGSNWTNHWLQLQYGWKPLLSDVYGAADALSKRPKEDWIVSVKGTTRDELTVVKTTTPKGTSAPTGNFDAYSCTAVRKRGVFVRLDAIPENDLTMSLVALGVTNPLEVAWELVPYSFVVDWFLPIGNWLSSLDAMLGYGKAWSSITTFNETRWVETGRSRTDYTIKTNYVKNSFSGSRRLLKVSRVATPNVPIPTFPEFKDPRSLAHMANGLSLLAQAFSRR